jgi:hypothetical protein
MGNWEHFVYGKKRFSDILMGLSLASTWAWGVSIVVGTQIVQQKGTFAFLIWAVANSLALTLFGLIAKRIDINDLNNAGKRIYKVLMIVIQFFSIMVNVTAIKTAVAMLILPEWTWMMIAGLLFAIVLYGGYDANIKGDILQIVCWMAVMLIAIVLLPKTKVTLPISNKNDILWAIWGGIILFSGPIVDKQMWQRKTSMILKNNYNIKPFIISSIIFGIYMFFVYLFANIGVNSNIATALVIIFVSGSTLQSALSALSSYGRSVKQSRVIMTIFFLLAIICLVFNASVLTLWTLYGSMRIPFSIYLVWRGLKSGRAYKRKIHAGL